MLQVFHTRTGSVRDADTVEFFPQQVPFPQVSNETFLRQAAFDVLAILQAPQPTTPALIYGDKTMNAFIEVATILKRVAPLQFPKEIQDIENDTYQPKVASTVAPTTPLDLPPDKVT